MSSYAALQLQELQSQHPYLRPSNGLLKEKSKTLGLANLDERQLQFDRAASLIGELKSSLPDVLRELLDNGSLAVGEIGLEAPNAFYRQIEENQFLVVMHSGLFEFLYRIARPLAAATFRTEWSPNSGIGSPDFARIVAEIIWWQTEGGSSFGPVYEITNDQMLGAGLLATFAEKFLLAHELGHVLVALGTDLSAGFSAGSDADEELIADWAAINITLAALQKVQDGPEPMLVSFAYAGAELALQIWGLMESIGVTFVDSVHPPASKRLKALRAQFRTYCSSDEVFNSLMTVAVIIEKTLHEAAVIILNPGEHAEKFELETNLLIDRINRLLEECSADAVPDYATFYSVAPGLFSIGYPHEVLSQVFEKIIADFATMRNGSSELKLGKVDRTWFNKFKLLFGLTSNMPEPAKTIYQVAFNRLRE